MLAFNYTPTQGMKSNFQLKWDSKSINDLGVTLTKRLTHLYKINFDKIHSQIEKDIKRWTTLTLDLSSRIEVIKMNIFPRLLYFFKSLPIKIPKEKFQIWDKMISKLIGLVRNRKLNVVHYNWPRKRGYGTTKSERLLLCSTTRFSN